MGTKKKNNPGGCNCCDGTPPPRCDGDRYGLRIILEDFTDCVDQSSTPPTPYCDCSRPYSNINGTYEIFPDPGHDFDIDGPLEFYEAFEWWSSPSVCCDASGTGAFYCNSAAVPPLPHEGGDPPTHVYAVLSGEWYCASSELQVRGIPGNSSTNGYLLFTLRDENEDSTMAGGVLITPGAGPGTAGGQDQCCDYRSASGPQPAGWYITTDSTIGYEGIWLE